MPSGSGKGIGAYLQRARFLAIAEFGPRSLVYHEGRAYRVYKAKLPPGTRDSDGRLLTRTLYVCKACGAAHDDECERCHACAASMAGAHAINHVMRIDNVETTSKNASPPMTKTVSVRASTYKPCSPGAAGPMSFMRKQPTRTGGFCRLDYATGALISRVNKGLRRRG